MADADPISNLLTTIQTTESELQGHRRRLDEKIGRALEGLSVDVVVGILRAERRDWRRSTDMSSNGYRTTLSKDSQEHSASLAFYVDKWEEEQGDVYTLTVNVPDGSFKNQRMRSDGGEDSVKRLYEEISQQQIAAYTSLRSDSAH